MNIGLFYGSSAGATEDVAGRISGLWPEAELEARDVACCGVDDMAGHDVLLFGVSTWNWGDIQDDWEAKLDEITGKDWSGVKIALFGCGDQYCYPDTFADGIGLLALAFETGGATVIGQVPVSEYEFEASQAQRGDMLLGLPLNEDSEPEMTDPRLEKWVAGLKAALS